MSLGDPCSVVSDTSQSSAKTQRVAAAQQAGVTMQGQEKWIDLEELHRAVVIGMTQLLGAGFRGARVTVYDELRQILQGEKFPKLGMMPLMFSEEEE